MTPHLSDARKYKLLRDFTQQLQPLMASEAIEVLARATAEVMVRDPSQFSYLANLFKHALDREYTYLTSRHRSYERSNSGEAS